ncbi:MAG: AtpZ/AtpI family protein [Planctomycetaceae bacterium]
MAIAMEWVSRIIAVALIMVLPGLGGHWLDARWGTSFLALAGFALGITAGIYHLLLMTKNKPKARRGGERSPSDGGHSAD